MLPIFYVILIVSVIAQVIYFYIFSTFSFSNHSTQNTSQPKVSVIICAKNEAKNLKQHLEEVLLQNYPKFEVIVVNDASTDNTSALLQEFQSIHSNLTVVDIQNTATYTGNKKKAITVGVSHTSSNYLVFTDADCKPNSKFWLSEMVATFSQEKKIVLGYGAYRNINNSLLNKLIRYETLMTAIQYFSYTKIGIPYMGVGRNLAYTKELFIQANGLESHADITSGDDDLFINEVATGENTNICYSEHSFTISEPKTNLNDWLKQKRRHITTASQYKPIHKYVLGLYYFSQLSFWIATIILMAFSLLGQIDIVNVMALILIRLLIQYVIVGKAAQNLNERDLILWIPLLDLYLVCMQFIIFITNSNRKPNTW